MNYPLQEAIESYNFGEELLMTMVGDIGYGIAMEAGEDGNTNNTDNTNTSTNNSSEPKNTGADNNDPNKLTGKSGAEIGANLAEKIKKLIAFIADLISKAIANFKGKLQYALSGKKQFENKVRELEKTKKPRVDQVTKKFRNYDFNIVSKAITTLKQMYNEYKADLFDVTQGYSKVLKNIMNPENFNNQTKTIMDKELHKNAAKYMASKLGPEFNNVESFGQLCKAIQCKHRGMKIDISGADDKASTNNSNKSEEDNGAGAKSQLITSRVFNDARAFIRDYATKMDASRVLLDQMNNDHKTWKSSANTMASSMNETNKELRSSSKAVQQIGRGLNFFTSFINYATALIIEQATQSMKIIEACYGE